MTAGVTVREATLDELPAVLGILDAAALETDADAVRASIERGETLVAVAGGEAGTDDEVPIGALVCDGQEITNVAVRRGRRGQGIGTALVEAAASRRDRLVAEFDADVRPFYEALGFDIEATAEPGRYRGIRRTETE